ncbi:hypothetical protein J4N02_02910 [Propioniciclava sp. MC1595]|uniref:hypothetical protein n=1 Tax=Propioniciclava sp. MC1595 TaxID=2760308 RepID=UPI0016626ED0|nr:hypothetical protein [Propioniciclava sp. MC1595]MBB1495418.1 hypothetical protein [Propioniciclava sp. MC1595]QTE26587.1 hypothetical protein J4N02_02910 [Propioniciclava sp. MC1595]
MDTAAGRIALVINPSKFDDPDAVRAQVEEICAEEGRPAPAWYETTVEDPGVGQAKQAVRDGATATAAS